MSRRIFIALVSFIALATVVAPEATAENPNWPPTAPVTREDLMDPATWPDDPGYGYDIEGDGMSCSDGTTCWTGTSGGDWNYWSWVPPQALTVDGFRADEEAMGSGTWTDMAWQHSIGDKSVVIAVLDSGIKWDERDLTNQFYLNQTELEGASDARCLPTPPTGHTGDPIDIDGDGYLTVADWFEGKDATEAAAITTAIDDDGNHNGIADPGDLITICTDGNDDDDNGYTDDISGWDFYADDNDPQDDNRYGHGTGEARLSMAAGNDGAGDIGQCPNCRALMIRVGDSFIPDVQDYAQSVIFAVDSGARVVQEALGSINHSTFMRRAHDYAYENDVVIIASAADENSYHHNFPGTSNHTLYVHAITYAGGNPQNSRSYLAFNNCTNFGGQLVLSAPGTGCSSEATGVTAGIAGVVYSAAIDADRPGGPLDPPLSAEELRQLLLQTAMDIHVPESDPEHPMHNRTWYPSVEGWDQRFGYGRVNTYNAVMAVREGRIPPEVDITYPDWFRVLYPDQTPSVTIEGTIDARRAPMFDYVIEWARGIEPEDGEFTTIAMGVGETEAIEGDLATWDISTLEIDNTDEEPYNRYTVTVRIRVTARYGGAVGDVTGEQRRVFAIHRDPSLLPGFPIALGLRNPDDQMFAASGEGSPKMADIDGDGKLEIVYGDADGLLHVFNEDASEVPGYPIQLGILRGYDAADPNNLLDAPAYASGAVPTDDLASSIVLGIPAIGDLEGDGTIEIVVPTMEGDVYAFHGPDGSPVTGFPIPLPEVPSGDPLRMGPMSPDQNVERGIWGAPALADLDDNGDLEIVVPGSDGHVYVFDHDGNDHPGFPVEIVAPLLWTNPADARPGRIITPPAIGDANGDGLLDIAVGSNETGSDQRSGAAHLIHGDGNLHAGGPEHDNWPISITSVNFYPTIGEGITSPLTMADVNDDDRPDIMVAGAAGQFTIYDAIQPDRPTGFSETNIISLNSANRGPLHTIPDSTDTPLLQAFGAGAFGDVDQDGRPDFTTGGAGLRLALNLAGGYDNLPFSHQFAVWNTMTGRMLPGFPQKIDDYLFFVSPAVADVDGDMYPESVAGSAGYYVRAWNACGEEPAGFPKLTGGWITGSVALGDLDGDDLLEMAVATRSGYLFAWNLDGPANGAISWPEYRHDNHNTGNYEMPLSNGGMPTMASQPIVCDIPMTPDGGVADGGVADSGMGGTVGGGGCECRAASAPAGGDARGLLALGAMLVVVSVRARRRR